MTNGGERARTAAVLPDSIVDLGLEGQYGPLSPDRCLAVMMKSLGTPVLSTAQASRPQIMRPVPRPVPPLKIRQMSDSTKVRAPAHASNIFQCRQAAIGSRGAGRMLAAQPASDTTFNAGALGLLFDRMPGGGSL